MVDSIILENSNTCLYFWLFLGFFLVGVVDEIDGFI